MDNKKPLGIVLIALSNAFLGVMLVPVGYVTAVAIDVRGAPSYAGWYGSLSLALGLFLLASAYGLWAGQSWGRSFALWVEVAMLPVSSVGLISLLAGGKVSTSNAVASVAGIVLVVFFLLYLSREGGQWGCQGGVGTARFTPDSLAPALLS